MDSTQDAPASSLVAETVVSINRKYHCDHQHWQKST